MHRLYTCLLHVLIYVSILFRHMIQATKNFDYIDLDVAVKALKIPKRRIYDVINILEGAGVLQRKAEPKNVFSWVAPLVDNTQEMQQALEQQDEQLDTWMEMLQNRQHNNHDMEECSISGPQLAPLLGLESTLLAVHVPQDSFLRTIHTMPFDNDAGPVAFKITTTNSPERNDGAEPKNFPKACLLQHGETKLRPVAVKTSLSPSKAAFVPYPKSPAIECHDPNPLSTLMKVLPKPPPKAGLSYKDVSPGFQPIEVSDDDEDARCKSVSILVAPRRRGPTSKSIRGTLEGFRGSLRVGENTFREGMKIFEHKFAREAISIQYRIQCSIVYARARDS